MLKSVSISLQWRRFQVAHCRVSRDGKRHKSESVAILQCFPPMMPTSSTLILTALPPAAGRDQRVDVLRSLDELRGLGEEVHRPLRYRRQSLREGHGSTLGRLPGMA